MTEEELLSLPLPEVEVSIETNAGDPLEGTARTGFALEEGLFVLEGTLAVRGLELKSRIPLPAEVQLDLRAILKEEELTLEQFVQDEDYEGAEGELIQELFCAFERKTGERVRPETLRTTRSPYLPPKVGGRRGRSDLLEALFNLKPRGSPSVPPHLSLDAPAHFLPDGKLFTRLKQHVLTGVPAVALLGPTGSGKTATLAALAAELKPLGYGAAVIDAAERLEGDRLFDRDDLEGDRTVLLEGVLPRLAREAKGLGIKLLVILNEFNALSDGTRREFYRLFDLENRSYLVQSPKVPSSERAVDFSHVQFLLTANPLSDRYLTDDLKRLSNAETRRLVVEYLDYEEREDRVKAILLSILRRLPAYGRLEATFPGLENRPEVKDALAVGAKVFLELTARSGGESLGYDVGYTDVALAAWSVALSGDPRAWVEALASHVLNKVPDPEVRQVAASRVRQATNIEIPQRLLLRGI